MRPTWGTTHDDVTIAVALAFGDAALQDCESYAARPRSRDSLMHRSTLAAALLTSLTVAMLLAESPAVADSKSVRDPRGDPRGRHRTSPSYAGQGKSAVGP